MINLDLRNGIFRGTPIYILAILFMLFILFLSVLYAVTVGSADLTVKEVYEIIAFKIFGIGNADKMSAGAIHDIVWYIRLPRIILGIAVGMGLAVAGAVMQAMVQNPLADPYILGLSSGASLGATSAMMLGIGAAFGSNSVGICAFLGAMLVSFAVIAISNIGGRATTVKLVLSGVAIGSVCSAFSSLIVYIANDREKFMSVTFWLMGSLAGAEWKSNIMILLVVLTAAVFFMTQSRTLNLMLLGEETAITLGIDLQKTRVIYSIITSLVVGFVVYTSGVIGFVGLIIPHFVRMLFGVDHKKLLPLTAITGSVFLVWADVFARTIIPHHEIPIGILISLIGAPAFILLLITKTYAYGGNRK